MAAPEKKRVKNPKELIKIHKLPCGPVTIGIDGTCRRRLRDHFDALLDKLTQETHPEGADSEILEMEEEVEIPEPEKPEETDDEKKSRLVREGKLKADVKKMVKKYEEKIMPTPKAKPKTSNHAEPQFDEETEGEELEGNSKLLQRQDGKMVRWQGKG
jgi:hypothetical protein